MLHLLHGLLLGILFALLLVLGGCSGYANWLDRTLFGIDCNAQKVGTHCVAVKKGE